MSLWNCLTVYIYLAINAEADREGHRSLCRVTVFGTVSLYLAKPIGRAIVVIQSVFGTVSLYIYLAINAEADREGHRRYLE